MMNHFRRQNSEGIRPGPGSVVEYNRLWDMGNLQHDGAAINIGTGAQKGTVVSYNWVHNTNRAGIRFDSTTTRMGAAGCAHHNVVFDLSSRGSKFKGDRHLLFNNTFYKSYFAIPNSYGDAAEHNRNTLVRNNLADTLIASTILRPDKPINARLENNMTEANVVLQNLRDPVNLDFRPKPGSTVIDAGLIVTDADRPSEEIKIESPSFIGNAPDIGAYEAEDFSYWIPGRMEAKAATPIPPNGAQNVKRDADLMFLEAYRAEGHVLCFSNAAGDHKGRIALNGSNIANPGELRPGQRYSWHVDAVMPDGVVGKGDQWTFTVEDG